ncbi:unnamed protein product [Arabis nemorensis]|uniref:Uncharacterized protein n=1 Tax=Arabis nemorensis TaxID=586526 RepID=A0A565CEL1_9BRAS|nr:unnamed protein product [Arabis nemorensis]
MVGSHAPATFLSKGGKKKFRPEFIYEVFSDRRRLPPLSLMFMASISSSAVSEGGVLVRRSKAPAWRGCAEIHRMVPLNGCELSRHSKTKRRCWSFDPNRKESLCQVYSSVFFSFAGSGSSLVLFEDGG